MKSPLRFAVPSSSSLLPHHILLLFASVLLFSQQLPLSLGLTLSKLLDDPTSLLTSSITGNAGAPRHWLRVTPHHSRPLWFSLPGMVPLASDPPNLSSKPVPASANRYSTSNNYQQSSLGWQPANSDQNQKSAKTATLADVNFPNSGSNRDAPLISTKVLSKRNPATQQQHSSSSSSSDGNRYQADNFDPFSRVDLEDFFNDSPPEEVVAPVNSGNVINTAGSRRRGGGGRKTTGVNEPMDIDGFRDMLKIDQLENMFDMDFQF